MKRDSYLFHIAKAFNTHPIVVILGPRQCGKKTLARMYANHLAEENYFDLEDIYDLERLETP